MIIALALVLAAAAGFALQRGQLCAVSAVREAVLERRWARFAAFLECSAWALAGLMLADAFGVMSLQTWPENRALPLAIVGGVLFGVGALINGACAFGTAGRIASGQLGFLAFAPGFVAGVWVTRRTGGAAAHMHETPMAFHAGAATPALALALIAFALWRLHTAWRAAPTPAAAARIMQRPDWPPAVSMAAMAAANVGLMLIVFAWPYTTLLVDLAIGAGGEIALRAVVVAAFFAGAVWGAMSAGRFALTWGSPRDALAHAGGGALMGAGAALIPGGNDALVLLGMPLLQPAAFAAYAAMCATIAAGLTAQRVAAGA